MKVRDIIKLIEADGWDNRGIIGIIGTLPVFIEKGAG
jgi:hypothetical protein